MASSPNPARPLLLLAEDDTDAAFFFSRYFTHACADWDFAWVHDGAEALDYIQENPIPRILVTDLSMSLMDGFELIEKIKAEPRFQKLPVIVYTSSNLPVDRQRCQALGVEGYFCKQPSLKELKNLIAFAISR